VIVKRFCWPCADRARCAAAGARRELAEEAGLAGASRRRDVDRRIWPARAELQEMTLNAHHLFELDEPFEPTPNGEVSAVNWFALDTPPAELAFRDHRRAVLAAAARLLGGGHALQHRQRDAVALGRVGSVAGRRILAEAGAPRQGRMSH
jgi:NUDIX domain